MIPKTNMKVVIPNMNTLGGDEVKPGLFLKATILSACAVLPSKAQIEPTGGRRLR